MVDVESQDEKGMAGKEAASKYCEESSSETEQSEGVAYLDKTLKRIVSRRDSLEEQAGFVPGLSEAKLKDRSRCLVLYLAYQSIGVVYGDMGTSPLYVYSSAFSMYGVRHHDDILGALSLILYTLMLSPLIKYVFIVLRASDNGEGGTFALYSLIARYAKISIITKHHPADRSLSTYKLQLPSRELERSIWIKEKLENSNFCKKALLFVTLLGTSMIIGDGIITPSISVLSAVSGLRVSVTNLDQNVVVAVSIVILVLLFSLQRFGTNKVGFMFAPALFIWFILNAFIGVHNILKYDPYIFRALNPVYIYSYFQRNGKIAWLSLGGIVLCITGTEAMYADLGHFSARSIQIAFTAIVFPSLVVAYSGQAAYLMTYPGDVADAFYKSVPGPLFWPMFGVSTLAAVIASQAMISASFSVMKQCEALGCFPRLNIVHTSRRFSGQIYIPEINWMVMVFCVMITAHFRSTEQLGNAYGVAVVTVMFITTIMTTLIMLLIWQIHLSLVLSFALVFGFLELLYISSVLVKVDKGGWVPLALAGLFLMFMYVWHYGTTLKTQFEVRHKVPMSWLYDVGPSLGTIRLPGICLIYNELIYGIPAIFHHLVTHLPAMHSIVVFVCIRYLPVATVPQFERVLIRRVGPDEYHMYRCVVRYGYRDMRTETARTFEQLLMQSLEIFIRKEAHDTLLDSDNTNSETPTPLSYEPSEVDTLRKPLLSEEESSAAITDRESASSSRTVNLSGERKIAERPFTLDDKLYLLSKCKEAGIVYMMGHGHVKARKDSFFLKKLVVNYFYTTLRRNCRRRAETLHIPSSRLMQIGMTYFV
ncbi:hypothetical protein O6H91_02G117700 [Diphasiastrum complanatum]|uniref:Uncharacterized protein n=2 Tax=Diphasiastrum complanatum TaxID=34168 RepID=A0ACC2EK59_DIPCM|nr:hypothetical protein O6H91_Y577700 [Diphasiastrum complanatum]KAJ7566767.1 hypothetical protein O6H91_02G117700 [Diphasiastrum complanatum]KAJ7566768.1 hypothetical protein O6H91_02G117700 [Diphasiastrum complanatum]